MKISKEVGQEIKLYQSQDYEISEETTTYFLMKKNTANFGGHVLVFLLTFWFTFGIGNLIYHFVAVKKRKVMK